MDWLSDTAEAIPLGLRGLSGILGGLLMIAGARLYPLAIMAPGLLLGLGLGLALPETIDPSIRAIAAVAVAGFGALVCRFVERAAVAAFGAVVTGGLVHAAWPLVMGDATPWWGAAAGAVVGLLLFPRAFKALLIPLTALLGAIALGFALGVQDNLLAIGGMAAAGTIGQLLLSRRSKKKE